MLIRLICAVVVLVLSSVVDLAPASTTLRERIQTAVEHAPGHGGVCAERDAFSQALAQRGGR
ncbi:hypothetical protein OAX78_01250 [Planctomycetota bacterium]|nr:hypothetical protein [Planctomycetota bacterium]